MSTKAVDRNALPVRSRLLSRVSVGGLPDVISFPDEHAKKIETSAKNTYFGGKIG